MSKIMRNNESVAQGPSVDPSGRPDRDDERNRVERSAKSSGAAGAGESNGGSSTGRFPSSKERRARLFLHEYEHVSSNALSKLLHHVSIAISTGTVLLVIFELIVPNWIPINRLSMITLLIPEIVVGLLDYLLFNVDVSLFVAIPIHCVCTFATFCGWVFVNGWMIVFEAQLLPFVIVFVVMYMLIWLTLVTYYRLVAWKMNRDIAARFKAKQKRRSGPSE